MKTVDHRSEEQLLVAAYQQTTQNLTRRYPTIACEDIQDAVSQATADLLSAGGVSALLDKKCLYQYILVSAERNIWHLQKRDAVMVRLESIDNFESSAWIADDVRTDDRAAQHILRSAIEKQIGEENAAIVWQYVMDGDKPQEIAKDFQLSVGAVYARLQRNLIKLKAFFTPPPQIWIKLEVLRFEEVFFVSHVEFSVSCSSVIIEGAPHSLNPQHLASQWRASHGSSITRSLLAGASLYAKHLVVQSTCST